MKEKQKLSSLKYEVPYADTDRMGIIYYANYLIYFERARTRVLDDLGYPYPRMEADGIGLPVIEAHVEYKSAATYGDILDLTGWLAEYTQTRLKVGCEVHHQGRLLARGHTFHACLNLQTQKPTRLPKTLMEAITAQHA